MFIRILLANYTNREGNGANGQKGNRGFTGNKVSLIGSRLSAVSIWAILTESFTFYMNVCINIILFMFG